MKRKTKIICTMGPAVASYEKILRLAQAGMDCARLNFSHGSHEEKSRLIDDLRKAEAEAGKPLAILADIQGPKIRVAKLAGGEVQLKKGAEVWMTSEPMVGGIVDGKVIIPVGYPNFVKDVGPGNTVLLEDGLMELKVVGREGNRLRCEVVDGGVLKDNKGINVPEASFSALAITDKDYTDILFCIEQGVDFIAMSFVRTAQEVRHLKHFIASRGRKIAVLAKIEKRDALTNLDDIIDASDGVMVARGDLAVEVGNERVPVLQKKIVRRCNLRGKTVIIATQMLMSMVENPRPSRAEASDVANAIVDGADCLMLSNETAVGAHPFEAVGMMVKIIEEMEHEPTEQAILYNEWMLSPAGQMQIAILQSAVRLASITEAKAIAVMTQSGSSALLLSKCRPRNPVYAITTSHEVYRQMALKWGVQAIVMEDMADLISQTSVFESIGKRLQGMGLCIAGDRLVITAGLPRLEAGSTNTIKLHQL